MAFVSMSLFPVGLVLYFTGTTTRNSIVTAEYAKADQIATQIKRELALYLGKTENLLVELREDPLITDLTVTDEAKDRELRHITEMNPRVSNLRRVPLPKDSQGDSNIRVEFFGPEDRTSSYMTWHIPVPELGQEIVADTPLPDIWRILDGVELGNDGSAILIDARNQILSHRNKTRLRTYLGADALGDKGTVYQDPDGNAFYTVAADMGKPHFPFRIVLMFGKLPIDMLVLEALLIQMLIGCLTSIVAWTLGILAAKHLTAGLAKASKMAEVVADGNLEARLPNEGATEVKQLADSFNTMVSQLEIHQNHLEELVEDRTADLQAATSKHRQLAAELQATYNAGMDGLWLVHKSGATISFNAAFGKMFGLHPEKGEPAEKVFQVVTKVFAEKGKVMTWLQNSLEDPNATERVRWDLVNETGVIGGYSSSVSGEDNSGEPFAVLYSFSDFSKEARIQRELEEARRFESVGHLTSSVAHEFNNLLAAVIGNLDMACDSEGTDSAGTLATLGAAKNSATKAVELVRGLLSFSQQNLLQRKKCELKEVINASLKAVYQRRECKKLPGVRWEVDIAKDLKQVFADKIKIGQALEEFLDNAMDAIGQNGVISVRAENVPDIYGELRVEIQIKDNGAGIASDVIDRIFEPFFSTRDDRKGLGLAMCHGVINQHEGSLACESEIGKGTSICIQLPVAIGDGEFEKPAPSSGWSEPHAAPAAFVPEESNPLIRAQELPINKEAFEVLVVDDDPLVRTVTEKILLKGGYRVVCAESGKIALSIYREKKEKIGLIVLDLRMPEMMGTEVLKHLHEEHGDEVPVIVCSGYLRDFEGETDEELGLQPLAFLEKPVAAARMLDTVGEVLSR